MSGTVLCEQRGIIVMSRSEREFTFNSALRRDKGRRAVKRETSKQRSWLLASHAHWRRNKTHL